MNRRLYVRRSSASLAIAATVLMASLGMQCPPDEGEPLNPPINPGNRAPRLIITAVTTPTGGGSAEQGQLVTIDFTGNDSEDRAIVRIFASASDNPTTADEIPILNSFPVGPGEGKGRAFWRTNNVVPGSYFVYGEISDGTFNANDNSGNLPVQATFATPVLIVPEGIGNENGAPTLAVDLPATDAGLSNGDTLSVRSTILDPDSDEDTLNIRILFDKDRNSANDDVDPPLEVATQTIAPGTIAPNVQGLIQQDIIIDLNVLPIRLEVDEGRRPLPYFVRVEATDGNDHVVNEYAAGAIRLLRAGVDVVDTINTGSTIAGATWQGFDGNPTDPSGGSRAGSGFCPMGDLDGDGFADFAVMAESASPFNRPNVGEVYVIYGRQRRIPADFAAILGFGSGRYAGVIPLNTVSSFVPFPPNDPRFELYFNIRGTIIPQEVSAGASLGVQSVARLSDITQDGRPELLIGVPFVGSPFDQEDIDPCDQCAFDPEVAAPFTCLGNRTANIGGAALTAEIDGVQQVGSLEWAPIDPVGLDPNFAPNVDFELEDSRIVSITGFQVLFSGQRDDEADENFTVDVLLEKDGGPIRTVTINPDAEGTFVEVPLNFPVAPNFPVGPDEKVPPSVYDGQFLVFIRPSVGVDFDTITIRIDCNTETEATSYPIKFTYFDDMPGPLSQNTGCGSLTPPPINPLAILDFTPVCPPQNRSQNPLAEQGLGNADGHECSEGQVQASILNPSGLSNDDLSSESYQTGLVFVSASNDMVMTVNTGVDANLDGVPDDGAYGTYRNDGRRVAYQRFFGQPPYVFQGGLGMRGARFRGAWYQPQGIYDPFSLFGFTVDTMPDFNTYGLAGVSELLMSAPGGGTLSPIDSIDLSADLARVYDHNNADPNTVESATAPFNFGIPLNTVVSATVQIRGTSNNIARLRVGIDDGTGHPFANGVQNLSREALLWTGAGFPPEEDATPLIEYPEIFEDNLNFNIDAEIPLDALQLFQSGQGKIAIELLPDCTARNTKVTIASAVLRVRALVSTGYVLIEDGDDYTCSVCTGLEDARCQPDPPNADPEGGEGRPMSWPSYGCTSDSPPQRAPCSHGEVGYLFGERSQDLFGFAHYAGDLNLDGVADIACGAPGSDNDPAAPNFTCGVEPNPLNNNGKVYFIYGTPTLGQGRPCDLPERFEIRGSHNDDQFGRVQGNAGDMDGDGFDDVYFAGEGYDALGDDFDGDGQADVGNFGVDVGFVGVLFGRSYGNGTRSIRSEKVGTLNFPGAKFVGGVQGARLGGGSTGHGDPAIFGAAQRGQHGVSSAGDFNLDGIEDLLITAPGQAWPAGKIEFEGPVADGELVSVNGLQFEFDTNGSITAGRIKVTLKATDALTAQRALLDAMAIVNSETLGVASLQSQNQFPAPLPDTPTINFLRRTYTPLTGWVTATGAGGAATKIKVTESTRLGVSYLVFGDLTLLKNKTFVLPQDLNRRNSQGKRVLKGVVFVGGYEKNSGLNDATPDEAPIEAVSRIGDIDGDGFVDIILGAPQADFINIIAPDERRQASGEAYLIYGNNFGLNAATAP